MNNMYVFRVGDFHPTVIVMGICKANNEQEVIDKAKQYCKKYTDLDVESNDFEVNVWTVEEWADTYDEELQIGAQFL